VLFLDAAWTQVTGNSPVGLTGNMHERAVVLAFNGLTLPVCLGAVGRIIRTAQPYSCMFTRIGGNERPGMIDNRHALDDHVTIVTAV